ncbi:MAG: hypothetical protein GY716_03245, partial [bacterium]|nr:hypothetical protein [bacterium]
GVQDPGEPGIGGVTLDLIDSSGAVVATATTSTDGSYLFTSVSAGTYTVAVTDTAGVLAAGGFSLTASADFPSETDSTVSVPAGGAFLTADFGYNNSGPSLGSITDLVYLDNDFSGTFTVGDALIDGASVILLDASCVWPFCYGQVLATDVSGNDGVPGEVSFPDLPAGSYALRVLALPSPLGATSVPAGCLTFTNCNFLNVALASGVDASATSFGYSGPDFSAVAGDRVWLDVDGDGVEDPGEPGLANVQLQIFLAGGDGAIGTADDTFWDVTYTDSDGYYIFRELFDALFNDIWYVEVVAETVPAGLVPSAGFSNPDGPRPIVGGGSDLGFDFGYTNATHLVGDFVWIDANDDGTQDPGEPGIGGVTLTLTDLNDTLDPLDDRVVATTVTRSDGFYLFAA